MATQPTNIIDIKTLDEMRKQLEGDRGPSIPDQVGEAIYAATEPVREVFVGVPEIKTFVVGYFFGFLTFAVALLTSAILH